MSLRIHIPSRFAELMLVHFLLAFLLHVVQADEVELLTEYYFKKDLVCKEGNFKY